MTKDAKLRVLFFILLGFFLLGFLVSMINLIMTIIKSKKKRRDLVTDDDIELCIYSFLGSAVFLAIWWVES